MAAAHGIVLKRTDPVEMCAVVMIGIVAENGGWLASGRMIQYYLHKNPAPP